MGGERSSDYEDKLLQTIEKFGWQSTSVFDPDGNDPTFTYSIGFTSTLRAPEFIVFGFDTSLMHAMLGEVFNQIQKGKVPSDDSRWSNVLGGGVECFAKAVHPANVVREYLNSAIWYWNQSGNDGVPLVLQLFWPGRLDGLFPWDEGCDQSVRDLQPTLYERIPPKD